MFGLLSIKEKVLAGSTAVLLLALAAFAMFHFFQVKMLEHTISRQAETISGQQLTIANQKVSIINLNTGIDKQNKAVLEAEKASKEKSEKAQAAIKAQAEIAAKWIKLYSDLLNSPKPAEDDCKALSIRFSQYFELRAKEAAK